MKVPSQIDTFLKTMHRSRRHQKHRKNRSKSGEQIVRKLRRLGGGELPAIAITDWLPCGDVLSAPNPQLSASSFDVDTFESGMRNGMGLLVQEPDQMHGRGFVLLDNGPLGAAFAVPKDGVYTINALMRFLPTLDEGNARFQDMWEEKQEGSDQAGFDVTAVGKAHLVGSRIVAVRVLRDGMIVDTIEGKNEAYELCDDDGMWVGHRVANVAGAVALRRHDRLVVQAWQNSGEDQTCFVRFSAICVSASS